MAGKLSGVPGLHNRSESGGQADPYLVRGKIQTKNERTMTEITIDELKQYMALKAEKKQIEDQIEALYRSIRSARFGEIPSGSSIPGNPTERTAFRIIDLKQELEVKSLDLYTKTKRIEKWLETVDDPEVRAIIRAHYILGKTWAKTAHEVYGYAIESNPRMVIKRYFKEKSRRD